MNDLSQKRLVHDQTLDLLDEQGLFMKAVMNLEQRWLAELINCRDQRAQDEIVARMKALKAIPEQLKTAINDYKVARKYG